MTEKNIIVKGARVNNLKNIDIEIPRNKFIVITGLSGSGKSSLAFDTLYAEGQRRYVESLSSYARQFLGRMNKPECDFIKGIPPAIAIQQKVSSHNPRSTVGTSTEIYEYLRLLFSRVGKTISPISGTVVKKHQIKDIIDRMLSFPEGTRMVVLSKIIVPPDRTLREQLDILQKEGFARVEIDGEFHRIDEILLNDIKISSDNTLLVIDRLSTSSDIDLINRLSESIETAFYEGDGQCIIKFFAYEVFVFNYSKKFEADGITFQEPTDLMFSFNNPIGACPVCDGYGKVLGIDEDLVIPDKNLSIYEGAVVCWKGDKMSEWKNEFIRNVDQKFPIHRPYYQLTSNEKDLLWHGAPGVLGIDAFFKMVEENLYKIQYRVMLARYRGKTVCKNCNGSRLKPEASFVKIGDKSITELVLLPIDKLKDFFEGLKLDKDEQVIAHRLLTEITSRIQFMIDVGLGYLTLNRVSSTLSGGETQRINLATSLGSSLVGSLYILDEPSIGLHARDTHLLIKVLRNLQKLGNTVIVVEHDEEIIRAVDYIIDIGPKAGRLGGEVMYQGEIANLTKEHSKSYTVKYLTGEEIISVPKTRRSWNNYIEIIGARQNNLKNINVKFPLNVMTVVTGVSGSGKSSLVCDVLYNALYKYLKGEQAQQVVYYTELTGDLSMIKGIQIVDQHSIGKSSRSNPITYIKAYDEIRKIYADQPLSKQMSFTPAYFSFNIDGGRCDECKGEGRTTIEMQFMADIVLECESCKGKRFKPEILEVLYRGKNIFDILELTVDEAVEFFQSIENSSEKKILKRLKCLQDVGLGYIKMGQSSSTLSGGENQRVKLAYFLSEEKTEHTIFIFDEPTTGLHFHDINTLLQAFNSLISRGHTLIIIEHNLDIIKCADHIIDIGLEGGEMGGNIVFQGTPEEMISNVQNSYTAKYLFEKLK